MKKCEIIDLRNRAVVSDVEHLRNGAALHRSEAAPEINQGQFVAVFNELARQWAARRNLAAQKPVRRHLKIIGNCDRGDDTAAISAGLNTADCAPGHADDIG